MHLDDFFTLAAWVMFFLGVILAATVKSLTSKVTGGKLPGGL